MGCDQLARNPSNSDLAIAMARGFPKQVDKILQLTSALLKYSKELSQEVKLDRQPLDWISFLKSTVEEFKAKSGRSGLNIEINSEKAEVPTWIDPAQMSWVLNALLTNAIQACPGSAEIKIQVTSHPETGTEVSLSDNGPGISAELQERLFEPFVSPEKMKGLSLGLSLSQRIVEAHGGTLQLRTASPGPNLP